MPSYNRLVRDGINGVINEAQEALANLDMKHDVNGFKKKLLIYYILNRCRLFKRKFKFIQ